jgi:hypothetical protein
VQVVPFTEDDGKSRAVPIDDDIIDSVVAAGENSIQVVQLILEIIVAIL